MSRFEHIDASATWSGSLQSALWQWLWFCCLIYYFGLCRPFVVCGAQPMLILTNAYVKGKPGMAFFGFRSTRRGKSSAC